MHRGPARELKLCDPGGRPAVHAPIEAAELRCFVDVCLPDPFISLQVGDGARELEHAIVRAGRQAPDLDEGGKLRARLVGCIGQPPRRRSAQLRVAVEARDVRIAPPLEGTRPFDPLADRPGPLSLRLSEQIRRREGPHFDVQIESVDRSRMGPETRRR